MTEHKSNPSCDNCGRPFQPQLNASHKRFCSPGCRQRWHLEQRKAGLALLRQQEKESQDEDR